MTTPALFNGVKIHPLVCLTACTLVACSSPADDEGMGPILPPALDDDTGSGAPADEGGGELFDVASGAEGGGDEGGDAGGCEKVDILFVIDDSGSMEDDQQRLIANFPAFVEGIETKVDVSDYHVGITATDPYHGTIFECREMGALVTQTFGDNSSNRVCGPFANGKRFMTAADDLDDKFACAAQLGTMGLPDERPAAAVTAAVTEPIVSSDCNDGFLREDAVLVVVMITDEEDEKIYDPYLGEMGSDGEPIDWFNTMVAAKGGNEESIVMLSLVVPPGTLCPPWGLFEPVPITERLIEFTEMFTYGFVGDICEPSYADYFAEAMNVVDAACDGFVPPG